MSKVATNLSIDADLKKACQELYADLGMDLTTAVTIFFKQSLRVQGIPFPITRENHNAETIAAMNEYHAIKEHPEKHKRFATFKETLDEALNEA